MGKDEVLKRVLLDNVAMLFLLLSAWETGSLWLHSFLAAWVMANLVLIVGSYFKNPDDITRAINCKFLLSAWVADLWFSLLLVVLMLLLGFYMVAAIYTISTVLSANLVYLVRLGIWRGD